MFCYSNLLFIWIKERPKLHSGKCYRTVVWTLTNIEHDYYNHLSISNCWQSYLMKILSWTRTQVAACFTGTFQWQIMTTISYFACVGCLCVYSLMFGEEKGEIVPDYRYSVIMHNEIKIKDRYKWISSTTPISSVWFIDMA